MRLFIRKAEIVIGTRDVTELRVDFRVVKTLKPTPNNAEIKIYNPAPDLLKYIAENEKLPARISAGYEEGTSVIFSGELRPSQYPTNDLKGNRIVSLFCGDAERGLRTARIAKSFIPSTPPASVLREVARSLGVGEGNLNQAVTRMRIAGVGRAFSQGLVLWGSASQQMTRVCKGYGLEWSVQQGNLQILEVGKALDGIAIELATTPVNTGVIGSPTVDSKGNLAITTLMIPDVFPGRKIVYRGTEFQGQYIAQQTTHYGSLSGEGDWAIDIVGKRY